MNDAIEVRLKQEAGRLGFDPVGIAPAVEADGFAHFNAWLDQGFAGDMHYLVRGADARRHPDSILHDVKSVVMVAMTHGGSDAEQGRVAKYAQARDYHEELWDRLNLLAGWMERQCPGSRNRGTADTAPLLERDFARRAGLGWFGKNTLLINRDRGSFLMLGALLTSVELTPDPPMTRSHCGSCTACLDACPTKAFVQPYVLDARRCISYQTIESRSAIPLDLRSDIGEWIFGCDICQDVCPWNRRFGTADPALATRPELVSLDACEILAMTKEQFSLRFRGTAIKRSQWRGLLRNAAIVLGNRGDRETLPVLRATLRHDDVMIREAVEWAIERIETSVSV